MDNPKVDNPKPTFEACLKRLEAIVADLERSDLPLETSVQRFEEGMKLVAECRQQLDAAEGKIEILTKRAGQTVAEPFTPLREGRSHE